MLWYVQRRDTKKSGRQVKLLKTAKDLTCKIIFLWYVILCKKWAFEVVHKEESRDGSGHISDDWRRHCQNKN